jgi:hypothetical protein
VTKKQINITLIARRHLKKATRRIVMTRKNVIVKQQRCVIALATVIAKTVNAVTVYTTSKKTVAVLRENPVIAKTGAHAVTASTNL